MRSDDAAVCPKPFCNGDQSIYCVTRCSLFCHGLHLGSCSPAPQNTPCVLVQSGDSLHVTCIPLQGHEDAPIPCWGWGEGSIESRVCVCKMRLTYGCGILEEEGVGPPKRTVDLLQGLINLGERALWLCPSWLGLERWPRRRLQAVTHSLCPLSQRKQILAACVTVWVVPL